MTIQMQFNGTSAQCYYLPKAKLATDNSGGIVVEFIVTDGAPDSFLVDLQTTFTLCCTADKSHIYSSHCTLLTTCFKLIVANAKRMPCLCRSNVRLSIISAKGQLEVR